MMFLYFYGKNDKKQSEALTLHIQCKAVLYYLTPCSRIQFFEWEYLARILHSDETTGSLVRCCIDITLLEYVSYFMLSANIWFSYQICYRWYSGSFFLQNPLRLFLAIRRMKQRQRQQARTGWKLSKSKHYIQVSANRSCSHYNGSILCRLKKLSGIEWIPVRYVTLWKWYI